MRIELFQFQKDALDIMREKVQDARRSASITSPKAIVLSAPTGSGKTVMMTALFEAILDQPDDQLNWPHEWQPQPDAVILWVSDMPDLNLQTKLKIERQSDKVYRVGQLELITSDFDAERLTGGRIYFVNTQKLASEKKLVSVGDGRAYSIWTTFANTARAIPDRFYVVIDEAHRGMGKSAERQTIVQHFLRGNSDLGMVKVPMIIGVSATPQRFTTLLGDTAHDQLRVPVPVEGVRKSGLIKDRVLLHHPSEENNAVLGLMEEAARRWQTTSEMWKAHCMAENIPLVRPILLVQVEDGNPTNTDIQAVLTAIEAGIGRSLRDEELTHALQDKGDLPCPGRVIRYVEPSRIEENQDISVVFFKMALTTGWDCPRAEVMMSFRRGEDYTYIAQLLGRMVRTPLAGRVEGNAALNDVHVYLPRFDREATQQVVNALKSGEDIAPSEAGDARTLITLKRNPKYADVFAALDEDGLVTCRVNAVRAQSDIIRYQSLASRLTKDNVDPNAWSRAQGDIVAWMAEQVQALKASGEFEKAKRRVSQVGIRTLSVSADGMAEEAEDYAIEASESDIERQFSEATRIFGRGHALPQLYRRANADRDDLEVRLEAIVVAFSPAARDAIEKRSKSAFQSLYDQYRTSKKLSAQARAEYDRLRSASEVPEAMPWSLPSIIDFARDPAEPKWEKHLFTEEDGTFRTKLGSWEEAVLRTEMLRPDFICWLRNVDRKRWALEVPYQVDDAWRPMFPDFLVIRRDGEGFCYDILEPHDGSRDDNLNKAKGLAAFAKSNANRFRRVELIRKDGNALIRLDLAKSQIQQRVIHVASSSALDGLFSDLGFVDNFALQ